MAKKKNNSKTAVINRNNRKRGAKFEKSVADFLDMYVVPYSGSNARFGFGDIRDSENKDGGMWLGECKNRVCDERFKIEREWIDSIDREANVYCVHMFIAFMKSGRSEKYILLHNGIFEWLNRNTLSGCKVQKGLVKRYTVPKRSHNTKNYIIPMKILQSIGKYSALNIGFDHELGNNSFTIIRLEQFDQMLRGFPPSHAQHSAKARGDK